MTSKLQPLKTVGLFAGVGGLELGLEQAGHATLGFCEIEPTAQQVLRSHFPGKTIWPDVTSLESLPASTTAVTAGFPCQDLSQAGKTVGIGGSRSGLVDHVFRLLRNQTVEWVLLENVSFMLHLAGGQALEHVLSSLEELGYKWAYRVVDSRAFGLPQRRERVYILASLNHDPRSIILGDDAGTADETPQSSELANGFYWTEGSRGLGWAVNAVPTLKGGSSIGIPSPPAIWMPDGRIVKPSIQDAERMQGFPEDWTKPAEEVARASSRWKLIGNAVTVDVAAWIGHRLRQPIAYARAGEDRPFIARSPWPRSAYNVGLGRHAASASSWPFHCPLPDLGEFLDADRLQLLSAKATAGFLNRFKNSSLKKPVGFIHALEVHLEHVARTVKQTAR